MDGGGWTAFRPAALNFPFVKSTEREKRRARKENWQNKGERWREQRGCGCDSQNERESDDGGKKERRETGDRSKASVESLLLLARLALTCHGEQWVVRRLGLTVAATKTVTTGKVLAVVDVEVLIGRDVCVSIWKHSAKACKPAPYSPGDAACDEMGR